MRLQAKQLAHQYLTQPPSSQALLQVSCLCQMWGGVRSQKSETAS